MNRWIHTVLEDELSYSLAVLFACVVAFGMGMLVSVIV